MDDLELDKIFQDIKDSEDAIERNKAILEKYGIDYDDDDDDEDEDEDE